MIRSPFFVIGFNFSIFLPAPTIFYIFNVETDNDLYGKVEPFWITLLQICVRTIRDLSYFAWNILSPLVQISIIPLFSTVRFSYFAQNILSPLVQISLSIGISVLYWFLHPPTTTIFNIYHRSTSTSLDIFIFSLKLSFLGFFRMRISDKFVLWCIQVHHDHPDAASEANHV